MQRRSATTGLIVEASRMIQDMVAVLFDLERGTAMRASGTASRMVASWRTMAARSMLEFAIFPLIFLTRLNLQ